MDDSVVPVVVAVVVIVTIVAVLVAVAMRRRKRRAQLSPAELQRHEECRAADKAVKAARKQHEQAVRAAQRVLKDAQNPAKLAAAGRGNYVTPVEVCLNGNSRSLTPDVTAALDQTGDITAYVTNRSTLTRIVAGGAVAGVGGALVGGLAKKNTHRQIDNRELYLMVLAEGWQEVVKLDPTQGEKARALMQSINVAAPNSPTAHAQQAEAIAAAETALEQVKADTAAVDAALAAREALGEDPMDRFKKNRSTPGQGGAPGMVVLGTDERAGDTPQDVITRQDPAGSDNA
ncbi:hypothetical protein MOPEL_069_00390 [Mobilicoccus pelagius NBRC 104925]|uniref:Uncharacterized protein n=1 Tax=Mobilicoccus pelagius NBRC 104925 TaxID=1089455 RepID=H5URC6_9MICO|nr:hypothetical protein MOPEL_069_00390 [Mobilicoccus pelagius NBRC 104925]